MAHVKAIEWAGLDGEPGVWVRMSADRVLVGHLIDKHGFDQFHS